MVLLLLLFIPPLIMFWGQTVGGKTLIPTENLYQYEPYATYREDVGAPAIPHNGLVSDLVLQNYQWKSLIRDNISRREVPLWNPHQFSGIPFMAAGQQSTLYPLSLIYYALPLTAAYGWFTAVNLWLAGVMMYLFMRGIGVARIGAMVSAITYELSGFFIASSVFPMITGAAVWLPLLLLMAEFIIRKQPLLGKTTPTPWVAIGAVGLAFNILAGHIEMTIYTLLITAFYSAGRLAWTFWQGRMVGAHSHAPLRDAVISSGWLGLMVALGFGLGAIQFIPLYEVAQDNWRAERGDLSTVLGYAHPVRDVIQFAVPNFYGSPAHHSYYDLFTGETVQAADVLSQNAIDWGVRNYVEGALYLGILPLALAAYALLDAFRSRINGDATRRNQTIIFALLTLVALTFMFGLPTYAVIYILPGINQLNSPFRWIFAVTAGVAVLAGFGADALAREASVKWAKRFGYGLVAGGIMILGGLLVSRVFFDQIESILQRIVDNAAKASDAFADARMFYSYEFPHILIFGVVTLLSGVVFRLATRRIAIRKIALWQIFAVALVAVDLMIASWNFNPSSDPALLDFTPPAVQWLLDRQAEETPFRYTTLDNATGHLPLLQANSTMRYGLDDIRGYDSIISAQYVDFMRGVQIQPQLDANRIAPLYVDRLDEIDWTRLSMLNVRYIVTHISTVLPESFTTTNDPRRFSPQFEQVYEDEAVRIYKNNGAYPRVYFGEPLGDGRMDTPDAEFVQSTFGVTLASDTGREKFIEIDLTGVVPQWLIVSETYAPGWRAYVRPMGADDDGQAADERALSVERVLDNFQGVRVAPNELSAMFEGVDLSVEQQNAIQAGQYVVRFVYSPRSFQVGFFGSVISAALTMFFFGVWIWRLLIGDSDENSATVSRVARNSVAPIILNLFNRGIDFAFAFVMLRILGPEDAGIYYYAIVVFIWFDIFTNFGLDVYLIREVSRKRDQSGYFFLNTSALRVFLMLACVPLLLGFLLVRQATVDPALTNRALLAIGLLYIGLAPGSLNKGLTSLFYSYEKAEYPAAVSAITTMNKATLGLIVLLLGYGIVGLAAVSIVVNFVTLAILLWAGRGLIGKLASRRPDRSLMRGMVNQSYPLMLNHFLATIFFQIDIVILEALKGARIVGKYSVAYRWLLALNIIPAFFTQALLPVMSRQANEDRERLRQTYTLAIKMLVAVAVPLAVVFTFLADDLTLLLGGAEFMPEGAIALQIMIWSIPIGWINSLTQYALIAVDLQRQITRAFIVAVAFNIVTNLIFIPQYGYQAAATTTILSEAVLLIPFGVLLQGALGRLAWIDMIWRPALAGASMFAVLGFGWTAQPVLALIAAGALYPVVLFALKPLSASEWAMLAPVLPARVKRLLPTF
jgi:O-antigen/teichoic acid export membrane protein